jgi:hypothetical protein
MIQRREALKGIAVMLGGAFSAPTLMALKRQEMPVGAEIQVDLLVFTENQRQIIVEVAELIIPRTATPGAKDAGVPAFIELMLKDCYRRPEHLSFLEGLKGLESREFLKKNETQRTQILHDLEKTSKEQLKIYQIQQTKIGDNEDQETTKSQIKGLPFWRLIKELTLLGYFTSEIGVKASFDYTPIPGRLELIKLKPGQKSFAY